MLSPGELPHSELDQLPDNLKGVVELLVENMPFGSWLVEKTTPVIGVFDSTWAHLRSSRTVINRFLGGEEHGTLGIELPKTMAVGIYPQGRRVEAKRMGLFSLLGRESYDPAHVIVSLGGESTDLVNHGRIDLEKTTGRSFGRVSPILGEEYLRNFSVVEFSPALVQAMSRRDGIVAYSLGGLFYFCARGQEFLNAYQDLLNGLGIKSNLGVKLSPIDNVLSKGL